MPGAPGGQNVDFPYAWPYSGNRSSKLGGFRRPLYRVSIPKTLDCGSVWMLYHTQTKKAV